MIRSSTLLLAFAFAICPGAMASADPLEPQIIPQCHKYRTNDGQVVCGWVVVQADGSESPDRWQLVLRADAELVALRDTDTLRRKREAALAAEVLEVRAALESCHEAEGAYRRRVGELTDYANERNRLYRTEQAKGRIEVGGRWGWYAAGAVAIAFGGYVALDQLGGD